MTNEEYELIADVLRKVRADSTSGVVMTDNKIVSRVINTVALELSVLFENRDENFDKNTFLKDCGV